MIQYFGFTDEIAECRYRIPVNVPADLCMDRDDLISDEEMNRLETTYGVHDVSFEDGEFFGFSSYEIEDWDAVLLEWKTVLLTKFDDVGDWERIPVNV